MYYDDTIAAIATSSKNGSISVIRVSGRDSLMLVSRIFYNSRKERIHLEECETHTIQYGFICDEEKNYLDEVLVLVMKAPRSYTTEDVVEIHCHGGHYICQEIMKCLINNGVRAAEPGEFTKRAFLNGRIDMSQAESVMDLIRSKSKLAMENSFNHLRGKVKDEISRLREMLLEDTAYLEAALDDPEHIPLDGFSENIEEHVNGILNELDHLIENSENGRLIREGIYTVITGKPNVGKSSLLNCLMRENRAIVTDIPGTTRDTLEEDIFIGNNLLHLIDTAGIHETDNEVENMGIEKARDSIEKADFIICVLNQNEKISEEDIKILQLTENKPGVVLLNKNDCRPAYEREDAEKITEKRIISFSAKNGDGLEELEGYIDQMFSKIDFNEDIYITNMRQRQALLDARKSLLHVKESIQLQMPEDMYSIDMTDAYQALGRIIGKTVEDDIINKIFQDFCMGK